MSSSRRRIWVLPLAVLGLWLALPVCAALAQPEQPLSFGDGPLEQPLLSGDGPGEPTLPVGTWPLEGEIYPTDTFPTFEQYEGLLAWQHPSPLLDPNFDPEKEYEIDKRKFEQERQKKERLEWARAAAAAKASASAAARAVASSEKARTAAAASETARQEAKVTTAGAVNYAANLGIRRGYLSQQVSGSTGERRDEVIKEIDGIDEEAAGFGTQEKQAYRKGRPLGTLWYQSEKAAAASETARQAAAAAADAAEALALNAEETHQENIHEEIKGDIKKGVKDIQRSQSTFEPVNPSEWSAAKAKSAAEASAAAAAAAAVAARSAAASAGPAAAEAQAAATQASNAARQAAASASAGGKGTPQEPTGMKTGGEQEGGEDVATGSGAGTADAAARAAASANAAAAAQTAAAAGSGQHPSSSQEWSDIIPMSPWGTGWMGSSFFQDSFDKAGVSDEDIADLLLSLSRLLGSEHHLPSSGDSGAGAGSGATGDPISEGEIFYTPVSQRLAEIDSKLNEIEMQIDSSALTAAGWAELEEQKSNLIIEREEIAPLTYMTGPWGIRLWTNKGDEVHFMSESVTPGSAGGSVNPLGPATTDGSYSPLQSDLPEHEEPIKLSLGGYYQSFFTLRALDASGSAGTSSVTPPADQNVNDDYKAPVEFALKYFTPRFTPATPSIGFIPSAGGESGAGKGSGQNPGNEESVILGQGLRRFGEFNLGVDYRPDWDDDLTGFNALPKPVIGLGGRVFRQLTDTRFRGDRDIGTPSVTRYGNWIPTPNLGVNYGGTSWGDDFGYFIRQNIAVYHYADSAGASSGTPSGGVDDFDAFEIGGLEVWNWETSAETTDSSFSEAWVWLPKRFFSDSADEPSGTGGRSSLGLGGLISFENQNLSGFGELDREDDDRLWFPDNIADRYYYETLGIPYPGGPGSVDTSAGTIDPAFIFFSDRLSWVGPGSVDTSAGTFVTDTPRTDPSQESPIPNLTIDSAMSRLTWQNNPTNRFDSAMSRLTWRINSTNRFALMVSSVLKKFRGGAGTGEHSVFYDIGDIYWHGGRRFDFWSDLRGESWILGSSLDYTVESKLTLNLGLRFETNAEGSGENLRGTEAGAGGESGALDSAATSGTTVVIGGRNRLPILEIDNKGNMLPGSAGGSVGTEAGAGGELGADTVLLGGDPGVVDLLDYDREVQKAKDSISSGGEGDDTQDSSAAASEAARNAAASAARAAADAAREVAEAAARAEASAAEARAAAAAAEQDTVTKYWVDSLYASANSLGTGVEGTEVIIEVIKSEVQFRIGSSYNLRNAYSFSLNGLVHSFYTGSFSEDQLNEINSQEGIFVEIDASNSEQASPNDPYYSSKGSWKQDYDDQWAIKRVGFTNGENSAWNLIDSKASRVVVAVIDSGLDWSHRDIFPAGMWINKNEIPSNEKDDDGNGYIDDIVGWNFVQKNNLPWDFRGHGTLMAGVIAGTQNNGIGLAGINPNAKIMVLKVTDARGRARASRVGEAIVYAANNGAQVINLSVGGKKLTRAERMAIRYAHSKGAVVVLAAGNQGVNVKDFGLEGFDEVITVAATDPNNKRLGYSNWGQGIDIAAPGVDVLGLRARRTDLMRNIPGMKYKPGESYVGKDRKYYRASGTSVAAPIVAGTASLILSKYPHLTNKQVKRMLLHSAEDIEVPGFDQYTGYGLLDARAALSADPKFFVDALITSVKVVKTGTRPFVRVTGTADADQLEKAWVEIGAGEKPTEWKNVSWALSSPVREAKLADIPTYLFAGSNRWTIRVITEHQNGRRREARSRLISESVTSRKDHPRSKRAAVAQP